MYIHIHTYIYLFVQRYSYWKTGTNSEYIEMNTLIVSIICKSQITFIRAEYQSGNILKITHKL